MKTTVCRPLRAARPFWVALAIAVGTTSPAWAQGVLRIGMTAADIPLTTGQADNGGEGMRFTGYTIYDALINWDLGSADKPSDLAPCLVTSWAVDEADRTKWTFKLRPNVTVQHGFAFTTSSIV